MSLGSACFGICVLSIPTSSTPVVQSNETVLQPAEALCASMQTLGLHACCLFLSKYMYKFFTIERGNIILGMAVIL
jgi:hypothetical protein